MCCRVWATVHLLYLLNLYVTVNNLAYHYHILHVKLFSGTRPPWKSATVDGVSVYK